MRKPDQLTEMRMQLVRGGYTPIPLYGKNPPSKEWQKTDKVTPEMLSMWAKTWPDANNTGVLTRLMPTLDLDIRNEAAARACEDLVRDRYEDAGYVLTRIGLPPKRAIPFRTEEPFKKFVVNLIAPNAGGDSKPDKIEFLATGAQVVVAGIHPETKQPYRWHGGELGDIKLEELPYIREEEAHQLVNEIVELLVQDFGYRRASERPRDRSKSNGTCSSNTHADTGGAADWQWLLDNIREGRELHDSLRDLAAKLITSGMSAAATVNHLRALMESSTAPRGERWQERYDDIPRAVDTAVGKGFDQHDATPHPKGDGGLITACAADTEMLGVDWLWPDRFALGKIGLIAGLPDYGKGQIAAFLTAAVTAAIELPCDEGVTPQGNVIWCNAEDDARDTVVPRLVAAGADRKRVHFVNGACVDGKTRSFNLITDLPLLRGAITRIGDVKLVIIDPISAYLGVGKVDGRSATDVRGVLTPLKEMAEELHIAVIGIAHFNKKDDVKSALLRVSDSIAYVAAARHVYAVLDDPEDKNCKLFVKAKNNLAPDKKALRYGMGVKTVGHDKKLGVDIEAPYIVWHPQHVEITANEAMAAAGNHTAKREAREFLLQRLEVGPMKQTDLIEEAKQEGIAEKTLRRAKKELGVKSYKEKGKTDGDWFWELPPKKQTREN